MFVDKVKISDDEELNKLLYLQKLFENGEIKEKDLSKEERVEIEKLYKHQIYELNKSINEYKSKIIAIKAKLKVNSNLCEN